jgi:hypothetical protein
MKPTIFLIFMLLISLSSIAQAVEPEDTRSSHIILSSEFINYQTDKDLTLDLNWFLVVRESENEINVTNYCPNQITLKPSEHKILSCIITDYTLMDTSYNYYTTGTYNIPSGGRETKISKQSPVVSVLDFAAQFSNAAKSIETMAKKSFTNVFDWINSFLQNNPCSYANKESCEKSKCIWSNGKCYAEGKLEIKSAENAPSIYDTGAYVEYDKVADRYNVLIYSHVKGADSESCQMSFAMGSQVLSQEKVSMEFGSDLVYDSKIFSISEPEGDVVFNAILTCNGLQKGKSIGIVKNKFFADAKGSKMNEAKKDEILT